MSNDSDRIWPWRPLKWFKDLLGHHRANAGYQEEPSDRYWMVRLEAQNAYEAGRWEEAAELYREAVKLVAHLGHGNARQLAEVLNNLADVYCCQEHFAEAEPLQARAVAAFDEAAAAEPGDPQVILARLRLAKLCQWQGKADMFAASQKVLVETQAVAERHLASTLHEPRRSDYLSAYVSLQKTVGRDDLLLKALLEMAEKGDPFAMYEAGVMKVEGRGCEEDRPEARKWLTRAVEAGQGDAVISLWLMDRQGTSGTRGSGMVTFCNREALLHDGDALRQCRIHEYAMDVPGANDKKCVVVEPLEHIDGVPLTPLLAEWDGTMAENPPRQPVVRLCEWQPGYCAHHDDDTSPLLGHFRIDSRNGISDNIPVLAFAHDHSGILSGWDGIRRHTKTGLPIVVFSTILFQPDE